MVVLCSSKCGNRAVLKRPKTGDALCKECFFRAFEIEIHETITKGKLFKRGDIVAIGASGGKDSTVLAYVLKLLNERYDYGLKLVLLSIDEGITGYRDDSLKTVQQNKNDYEMPLMILSYKDLYGWTMDEIVAQIGRRNNCTFCGVFRRQALDRGAALLGVNCIATGHNADDVAETVLMNILRGDLARLKRCTAIIVGSSGDIPRVKPLKYTYEKEIVMYAYFKKLVYFSTECVFAPNAYRGHARTLLKDLEKVRPSVIMDLIYSGETTCIDQPSKLPQIRTCIKCNYVSSQEICKACFLLEGLNRGLPKISIGKSSKSKRLLAEEVAKDTTKSISSKHSNSEIESSCTRCNCNKNKCSKVTNSENEIDLRKKISENLNDLENLNEVNVETCSVTNKSIKTKLEIRKDKHSNRIQTKNKTEIEKNDYENILESKINENCKIEEQSEVNKTFDLRNDVQINKKTVSLWNLPCEECVEKCNCISTKKKKIAVIMLLHQMHIQYSDDYDSDTNDF